MPVPRILPPRWICLFRLIVGLGPAASVAAAGAAGLINSPTALSAVQREAIRRELQDFSRAGIDRRLGPDYAFYHPHGPESFFPEVWMAPTKQDAIGRRYQFGGPWVHDPGLYSSTQGQILYAPDEGAFGVDRVTVLEWSNGCFSERPEPPWWGGFRPEPASAKWKSAANGSPGVPLGMARGMGGWANCGVILFSSGLVSAAGTATASGSNPTFQFPPEKIPTAIAVTTKNEFALVTVSDVATGKGQIAVLALQSGGERNFVHDWPFKQAGLPNTAWLTGIKLLGYIDLPGVEFPTGVTAVGNDATRWVFNAADQVSMLGKFDLSKQATRDSFRKGRNASYASTSGFAVVISKYENKAVFVDLQPLFKRVREMYFTTAGRFRAARRVGSGARQWPHTFAAAPIWKPQVIKVIDVSEPTAVLASMSGEANARAYIASRDGTVGIFQVGGLATEAAALPAEIARVGEIQVGRNPTCLAYQKLSPHTIIAVSRGDREIAWIQNDQAGARIIRRLRDARLADPVFVESADTHGIDVSLITVADFHGRKILNYRFSPVVFSMQGGAVFGMGPNGQDEFECGGVLDFPGSPFGVSATNVN